jgi:hypothetical protein
LFFYGSLCCFLRGDTAEPFFGDYAAQKEFVAVPKACALNLFSESPDMSVFDIGAN